MSRPILAALAALGLAGLAACASPPPPQDSGIPAPGLWNRLWHGGGDSREMPLTSSESAEVEQNWWQSFGDPGLDRLIRQALANNKTLQAAQARVAAARGQAGGARANLYPAVAATGNLFRGNQGYATSDKPVGLAEGDLQASWELDLFGKNQARLAQARALLQSEEARRQAVMVSLLADVARTYFDLLSSQEQLAIVRRNLELQQRTLNLIQAQQAGALSSDLDVQRAAAQVSTTAAQLPVLQAQADADRNRLAVLAGTLPGEVALPETAPPLAPLAERVLVAAPATVLANRPDIRAAERSFAASISAAQAASREVFPTISLAALFGIQESTLYTAAKPWSVSLGVVQPVLNFGRIQSQIDIADAQQGEAFASYQQTVLQAVEDMENALSEYINETGRQRDLDQAAAQDRRAVDLANRQYLGGYSGLLDLLVAQRDELAAESSLAASNAQLRKALVHVYAAAGGGWKVE